MTLLLYAIADREHAVPASMTGLAGEPLRAVSTGEPRGILGECGTAPEPTPEALLGFEQVVEALMAERTVLPARFGTVLPDEAAAVDLLTDRHRQFADALQRVGGAVEMGVRAGWADAEPARPSDESRGADYLLGRLEHRQRAQRVAAELDAALAGLARERACRILARPDGQVTAAYLVTRPRVDAFKAACDRLTETVTDASVICTGPWPPYSFVGSEET
jgi:Gas vesicle synthesis protein GvpL/GvpF